MVRSRLRKTLWWTWWVNQSKINSVRWSFSICHFLALCEKFSFDLFFPFGLWKANKKFYGGWWRTAWGEFLWNFRIKCVSYLSIFLKILNFSEILYFVIKNSNFNQILNIEVQKIISKLQISRFKKEKLIPKILPTKAVIPFWFHVFFFPVSFNENKKKSNKSNRKKAKRDTLSPVFKFFPSRSSTPGGKVFFPNSPCPSPTPIFQQLYLALAHVDQMSPDTMRLLLQPHKIKRSNSYTSVSNEGQSPSASRRQSYPQGKPDSTAIATKKSERFSLILVEFYLLRSFLEFVSVVDIREKAKASPRDICGLLAFFYSLFKWRSRWWKTFGQKRKKNRFTNFCAILFS